MGPRDPEGTRVGARARGGRWVLDARPRNQDDAYPIMQAGGGALGWETECTRQFGPVRVLLRRRRSKFAQDSEFWSFRL